MFNVYEDFYEFEFYINFIECCLINLNKVNVVIINILILYVLFFGYIFLEENVKVGFC